MLVRFSLHTYLLCIKRFQIPRRDVLERTKLLFQITSSFLLGLEHERAHRLAQVCASLLWVVPVRPLVPERRRLRRLQPILWLINLC